MRSISIAPFPVPANPCGCFTERLHFFLVHCCVLNVVLVSLLPLWNIERVLTERLTSLPYAREECVMTVAKKHFTFLRLSQGSENNSVNFHSSFS